QGVRKILTDVFEEAMLQQGIHEICDHRPLLRVQSCSDLFKRVLSIQIRGEIFYPAVDNLALHLERTLVMTKKNAIGYWKVKGVSVQFWSHHRPPNKVLCAIIRVMLAGLKNL